VRVSESNPPNPVPESGMPPLQPYGDLVQLNTHREVLDAVGPEVLEVIAEDYMELLGTSTAVYETNGDYALGIFSSGWCRLMDSASREICDTSDNREALASGKWHCHESCWRSARDSMREGVEVDQACEGGIRLFAVPVVSGERVVGAINFGYGDPPLDEERLRELSARFAVPVDTLRTRAEANESRSPETVEQAKRRLRASARLIGEIVARRRAEEELRERNAVLEEEVARRERAEAELREANETLTSLIRAAPVPVIALDLQGNVLSWNAAAERTFGWSEPEVLGRFNPIIPPERAEEARRLRSDVVEQRLTAGMETERWRKDGSRVQVSLSTAPLQDASGAAIGIILLLEDITDRKRAEEALRESERRFRFLVDAVPQQIWVTLPDGYHEFYSRRWYDYTGLTYAQSRGDGWRARLHPDDRERAGERWGHSLATAEPYEIEYRFRRHDGEYRWFLGQALPQRDDAGEIVRWIGTLTDIHDRKLAEAERDSALAEVRKLNARLQDQSRELQHRCEDAQALNGQLRQVNDELLRLSIVADTARDQADKANRAKMEFLSAMSHELRTPLNAIAGYVDLMEMGLHGPVSAEQAKALDRIKQNQGYLLALITDILNFAKLEAGRVEMRMADVPIGPLLERVGAVIEHQVRGRGLAYSCVGCDPELRVRGDEERIQQVLLNLLTNATKFTDPGGWVVLSCSADEEWVRLHVRDNGCGIAGEYLESIFDPFVQARRHKHAESQQGVGLGLAISRDLARAMEGELSVESEEGAGSTFTLRLRRGYRRQDDVFATALAAHVEGPGARIG
jgi:PAS domain S-box-containing protein